MNSLTQTLTESNPIAAIVDAYNGTGQRAVTVHANRSGKIILRRNQRDQLVLNYFPTITPGPSLLPFIIEQHDGTQAAADEARAWLTEAAGLLGEALPAPADPHADLHALADDVLALYAAEHLRTDDFRKRLASAVELVETDQFDAERYNTRFDEAGFYGYYSCQCPDAQYRGLYFRHGTACKHTLALHLQRSLRQQFDAAAGRRQAEQAEQRQPVAETQRDQALPASVDQHGSISSMLGYDDIPFGGEQLAAPAEITSRDFYGV